MTYTHGALARLQSLTPLVTHSKPSIQQTLTTVWQTVSALQTERDNILQQLTDLQLQTSDTDDALLQSMRPVYVNITPLKLLFSIFTIISLMPLAPRKYPVFVFLTSQRLLTPLITHNILITRLSSWFGLHRSVLEWFKSHLSDRCFCVKCENSLSSFHTCSCGVPEVLFLVLFFLSCIPLHLALSCHPSL